MAISGVMSDRARSTRLTGRREVYPSNEVPHLWAHGLPDGRKVRNPTGSFWTRGDTIYSYGEHFPIARRVDADTFLYNPARYSNTTGGHQSATRRAMPHGDGVEVFHLPPIGPDRVNLWDALARKDSRPIVEWFRAQIDKRARAAVAPRIRAETRAGHLAQIDALIREWGRVHARFGLRCKLDRVGAPDAAALDALRERVRVESVEVERRGARAPRGARAHRTNGTRARRAARGAGGIQHPPRMAEG